MSKKYISFQARVTKAFEKDGEMYVVAVASDTQPDYENDRMSERCIDSFVEQGKAGVDILDGHRTSFAFGRTSDAWKEEEADGNVTYTIEIKLKSKYPQSSDLFDAVLNGKETKQLSIGGWMDPDAGVEYEFNESGDRVRVINGITLDHIAVTRPDGACNARTGFLTALVKDILGNQPEFDSAKFNKALLDIQKQTGGRILTSYTSDAGTPRHFHEFAMHINAAGVVTHGETGLPVQFWEDDVTRDHTHKISELMRSESARDHHHILMVGYLELDTSNRLEMKVFPSQFPDDMEDAYDEWAAKVYETLESGQMPKDFAYYYTRQLSDRVDTAKSDFDKFASVFDASSVMSFVSSEKSKFVNTIRSAAGMEIKRTASTCSDEFVENIRGIFARACTDMFDYGLYVGGVIKGVEIRAHERDVKRIATVVKQYALDTKRDIEREIAYTSINAKKVREKVLTSIDVEGCFDNVIKELTEAFSVVGIHDEEKATFKNDGRFVEVDGLKDVKFPLPNGPIEDVIVRVSVISSNLSGDVNRIAGEYSVGKTTPTGGHFHRYIIQGNSGVALKAIGHSHDIKLGHVQEDENHVHKLGESGMKNVIPFESRGLAEVEAGIDGFVKDKANYAWYDDAAEKGMFLHHNKDGETVLRGLIVSYAELVGLKKSEGKLDEEELKAVTAHLNQHLEEFNVKAPSELIGTEVSKNDFFMHFEKQGIEMPWCEDLLKSEEEAQAEGEEGEEEGDAGEKAEGDEDAAEGDEAPADDDEAGEGEADAGDAEGDDAPAGEGEAEAEKGKKPSLFKSLFKGIFKSSDDAQTDDQSEEEEGDAAAEGDADTEGEAEGDEAAAPEGDAPAEGDTPAEGEEADAEGDAEKDGSILDIGNFRSILANAIRMALGGQTAEAVKELKSLDKALEKGTFDVSGSVKKTIVETTEAVLKDIMPELASSMSDIAKVVTEALAGQKKAFKGMNSLKSTVEKLEGYSGGSQQPRSDGRKTVIKDRGPKDGEEFTGMFDSASAKADISRRS